MATHEATIHPFPTQGREPLTITSEEISRYAALSALLSQLEAEQKTFRAKLLTLHAAGAEQGSGSPYLLAFVEQERHTVDWKLQALKLAEKLYGIERSAAWKVEIEQAAPVQTITQIRVKPNPEYAAGLTKPVTLPRIPPTRSVAHQAAEFGD
jgi:hypothetical protein